MQKKVKTPKSELSKLIEENLKASKRSLEQSKKNLEIVTKQCDAINQQCDAIKQYLKAKKQNPKPEWLLDIEKEYNMIFNHVMPGVGYLSFLEFNYSTLNPSMMIPEDIVTWKRLLRGFIIDHKQ